MTSYLTVHTADPAAVAARQWFSDLIPQYTTPTTTGDGAYRTVTNFAQLSAARAVSGPGDVIYVNGPITGNNESNACLKWSSAHPQGTAANPIIITCGPNGYFDRQDVTSPFPSAIDIVDANHIHVIGCDVRNAVFGIRVIRSRGSLAQPIKVWHNRVRNVREATIYAGALSTATPTEYVSIKYNHISDGPATADFNEGIYIGTGAVAYQYVDQTHDVEIAYNEVEDTRGDGIDIKLGTYNINVHHNLIHDIGSALGYAITTGVTSGGVADMPAGFKPNYQIWSNWIYDIGWPRQSKAGLWPNQTDAGSYSSGRARGINANLHDTQVYNNVIWGLNGAASPQGIASITYDVQGTAYPINIYNNTVWVNGTAFIYAYSAGSGRVPAYSNNISFDGSQGSSVVTSADFDGLIPSVNTQGSADSGNGPGSAFLLAASSNEVGAASGTTASVDITGLARPQGGTADRGAYERAA